MDQSQRKVRMNGPRFHPDIIFQILLCLPAEFLYDCAALVCPEWASIIRNPLFIEAHLLKSKGGLIFQSSLQPYLAHFLDLQNKNKTLLSFPFQALPLASCRGICLFLMQGLDRVPIYERSIEPSAALYVVNPITRQFQLLPSPGSIGFYKDIHIAYIEQSKEFKVVCLFSNTKDSWLVFTLGIDMSWRILDAMNTENILAKEFFSSAAAGQYVYLPHSEGIVAINLYDENLCSVQYPNGSPSLIYYLRKLGDNLSCIVHENMEIQVWMLRDLHTCEWVQLSDTEEAVASTNFVIIPFYPIGWLDNSRIFVIEMLCNRDRVSIMLAFNAETGTNDFFTWGNQADEPSIVHINSLVWW